MALRACARGGSDVHGLVSTKSVSLSADGVSLLGGEPSCTAIGPSAAAGDASFLSGEPSAAGVQGSAPGSQGSATRFEPSFLSPMVPLSADEPPAS